MTKAIIAIMALLAAATVAPSQGLAANGATGASVLHPRAQQDCPEPLPDLVEWIKVKKTDCTVGARITEKMRRYVYNQDNKHSPETAAHSGYIHRQAEAGFPPPGWSGWSYPKQIGGWACKAGHVGGDEVVMQCKKNIPGKPVDRRIRAFFYVD